MKSAQTRAPHASVPIVGQINTISSSSSSSASSLAVSTHGPSKSLETHSAMWPVLMGQQQRVSAQNTLGHPKLSSSVIYSGTELAVELTSSSIVQ